MDDRRELPPANAEPPYPEASGAADHNMPAAGVAPPPVGVYDRPEHTGKTTSIVIGVVAVIVLILLAILLIMFVL